VVDVYGKIITLTYTHYHPFYTLKAIINKQGQIMQHWKLQTLTLTFSALLLSACASKQIAISESVQQRAAQEASSATISPEQAIESAEEKLSDAKAAELEFFAPLHLVQAQESITQAREYLIEPPEDIKNAALMAAIAAQNFIEDAYKNKVTVQANLKEALRHKDILIELKTPSLLADDYQSLMEDFVDLVILIEKGKTAEAVSDQVALLADMSELEIKTLKNIHLTEAEAFYEKADDIDADEYAELSFDKAGQVLDASNNFIQKNYRDRKGVKKAGEEALWATKRAYYVALESEKVIRMEPENSEKHILLMVDLLNSINQKAYGEDLEPQKLYSATEALIKMVGNLKAQLETSKQETKLAIQKLESVPVTQASQVDQEVGVITTSPLILPNNEAVETSQEPALQEDEQGFDDVEVMVSE